jgi:Tol biopolymer transport system component
VRWLTGTLVVAGLAGLALAAPAEFGNAAFSGNNGKILFDSDRDSGNNELYVINADGTGQTRLTNSEEWEQQSSWSPDGAKIAFTRDLGGYRTIYVMDADGGSPVQLTNPPPGVIQRDSEPAWSPDGNKIAFTRSYYVGDDYRSDIYVMNADGSNQTKLTDSPINNWGPSWSPDGTKIAFVSDRDDNTGTEVNGNDVFVMNADGTGQTNLTNNPGLWDEFPDWSPDGSKIVFARCCDGRYEIYAMNPAGSGVTRLTDNPTEDYLPVWSPDGKKVAFISDRDGSDEIYVMNADGGGQARLTNDTLAFSGWSLDWQPLPVKAGDADCDGDVDAVDALQVLRRVAGLSSAGCVLKANVKCDDALDAVDALLVLRDVAHLSVSLPGNCTAIGSDEQLGEGAPP